MRDWFFGNWDKVFSVLFSWLTLCIAFMALSTWKKQLRGTAEYELVKRILLRTYTIRNILNEIRNPFISVWEGWGF